MLRKLRLSGICRQKKGKENDAIRFIEYTALNIINMVRPHGGDGKGKIMKRKSTRKPIVALALVTAMLFPATAYATEEQDSGNSGSVILNGGTGGEAGNAEAQEVYEEFLDSISFIATDPTWSDFVSFEGQTGLIQLAYDDTIPEGAGKIPYEELSDFDKLVYGFTYCCFAVTRNKGGDTWEDAKTSQERLAYHTYSNFRTYMLKKTGNDKEAVAAAFDKLWDWQYAYILEHDEPYDFVDQCTYSDMFPGSEDNDSESESLTPQESEEIEEILNELDESDKKEIQQAVEQEKKAENSGRTESSSMGIMVPVLIVLAVASLTAAFFLIKKNGGKK